MNRLIGAIFLIAGTSIGAGMLALPVITAPYGFLPSAALITLCWLIMLFAALLMLEVNLWLAPNTNLVSMAKLTIGPIGQYIAWISYLLLMYSLMAAYITGMNALVSSVILAKFHYHLYPWMGALFLIVLFGAIIYLGAKPIDMINRLLIIGLITAYILLTFFVVPHIQKPLLLTMHAKSTYLALPVVITSFGFQIIIPSLRTYLHGETHKLRIAIIIGSLIPLAIYLLWEFLIIGIIPPTGHDGLLAILASGQPATHLTHTLHTLLNSTWITATSQCFIFFAIATSFIGVSFSLFDFLSDGLHIAKGKLGRISIAALTFIPPLIFALYYPEGFILALGYAGIFVAILLMILPATMAASGRYYKKIATGYRMRGGVIITLLVILYACLVIIVELL